MLAVGVKGMFDTLAGESGGQWRQRRGSAHCRCGLATRDARRQLILAKK